MLLTLFFLLGCGEKEVSNGPANLAPTITISSHENPVELISLYNETFQASVADEDNNISDLMVSWYVDGEPVCDWQAVNPEGISLCDIRFNVGDQKLIANHMRVIQEKIKHQELQ